MSKKMRYAVKMNQIAASMVVATMSVNAMPVYATEQNEMMPISSEIVINTADYSGVTLSSAGLDIVYKLHEKDNYNEVSDWIRIAKGTGIRLLGDGSTPEQFSVRIEGKKEYHLKLDNIILDLRNQEMNGAPIIIGGNGKDASVTMQLVGENKLYAADGYAGIEFHAEEAKLVIESDPLEEEMGILDITAGSNAAAIGQGNEKIREVGDLTIHSGNIVARGGSNSAAIGARDVSINKINIVGGNVTAIAHEEGGIPIGTKETTRSYNVKHMVISGGNFVGIGNEEILVDEIEEHLVIEEIQEASSDIFGESSVTYSQQVEANGIAEKSVDDSVDSLVEVAHAMEDMTGAVMTMSEERYEENVDTQLENIEKVIQQEDEVEVVNEPNLDLVNEEAQTIVLANIKEVELAQTANIEVAVTSLPVEGEASYELTITNGIGTGAYSPNTVVDIAAITPEGMRFVAWELVSGTGQILNIKAPQTIFATGNEETIIEAKFEEIPSYELTVLGGEGSKTYKEGEYVAISASPEKGEVFMGWIEGDSITATEPNVATTGGALWFDQTQIINNPYISKEPYYMLEMPGRDYTVSALYQEDPAASHQLVVEGGYGSGYYAAGTEVTITANIPENHGFKSWQAEGITLDDTSNLTITFVMPEADVKVSAAYLSLLEHEVSFNETEGLTYEGAGSYKVGDVVTTSAIASLGYTFAGWTATGIDLTDSNQVTITFTMPANDVVLEGNAEVEVTPEAEKEQEESGYEVIVEGGLGSGYYEEGSVVVLHGEVPEGKQFDRWHIENELVTLDNPTSRTTIFIMGTEPIKVTASYMDEIVTGTYDVLVTDATGGGTYKEGDKVTITPVVPRYYEFLGWDVKGLPGVDVTNPELTFTMPKNEVVITARLDAIYKEVDFGELDDALAELDGAVNDVLNGSYGGGTTKEPENNIEDELETEDDLTNQHLSAEELITKLDDNMKNAIAEKAKEETPYTGIQADFTVDQLKDITNKLFTSEQLEEILASPSLLEVLGIGQSATIHEVVLQGQENVSFQDVEANYWAHDTIKTATELGLAAGVPGEKFAPDQPLQITDAFTFLDRGLLLNNVNGMNLPRSIVEEYVTDGSNWAFIHMASIGSKLTENTLEKVMNLGKEPLSRELLAQVLYEILDGKIERSGERLRFVDTHHSPYQEAINFCTEAGLLVGTTDERMSPEQAVTRAEMIAVVVRMNDLLKQTH